jgi:glycine dehydrogenase subunit 1
MAKPIVYSYMANSVPEVKQKMLKELGLKDIEDLYVDIPDNLRLKKNLNIPPPKSEYEVRSSITKVMAKNITSDEMLCFLGAGCWPHHVPAVCDERNYCDRLMDVKLVDYDSETGLLDIEDLKSKISSNTAGVYIENPSYLGFIEPQGKEISEIAHDKGALSIVGVEPTSLGILTPPGEYGADIVIGESQPLGMHMSYGGALCGFIAYPAEPKFLQETPRGTSSLATTEHEGVWSFVGIRSPRSMYTARERGTSFTGTGSALWGITAAVYMALMGPQGMQDLGEVIIEKSHYAMKLISEIKGVKTPLFNSTHFEEFTVNFDDTGKTVKEVNKALLKNGIQGGKDVTKEFPELGSTALYCVTEIHAEEDLEKLANVLREVIK